MKSRRLEAVQLLDEKVIQRYVFGKLNESTSSRRDLFPDYLRPHASKFKVAIPEYGPLDPSHRPDFRVFFWDRPPVNVEVEWTRSRFRPHGNAVAEAHYRDHRGFLIVLQDDFQRAPGWTHDLDVVTIDVEDFTWWFNSEAKRMLESSLTFHAPGAGLIPRRYWVVYVGKSERAQSDYLDRGLPSGKWAFRYTQGANLRNIMAIQRGDLVVFATKWSMPPQKGRQIYPGVDWSCRHVDVLEVTEGYWCEIKDSTFESSDWSKQPEDKSYMHYFRFSPQPRNASQYRSAGADSVSGSQFSSRDPADVELCDALRMSNTQAGAPFPIRLAALEALRRRLG